jgi:hypothetical protein
MILGKPAKPTETERVESVRFNVLCTIKELNELLDTTQWKDWATYPENTHKIDRENYVRELADVFTFFLNLVITGNVTSNELFDAYFEKNHVNRKRAESKYDGHWTEYQSAMDSEPGTITK